MELSSIVAKVSSPVEPSVYISSPYNKAPIEPVGKVEGKIGQENQYLSKNYREKAQEIQKDPVQKLNYTPGDLLRIYA